MLRLRGGVGVQPDAALTPVGQQKGKTCVFPFFLFLFLA